MKKANDALNAADVNPGASNETEMNLPNGTPKGMKMVLEERWC